MIIIKGKSYITAPELAKIIHSSDGYAYKLIRELNDELKEKGYLTFNGKVPRKYLEERCYGIEEEFEN